MAARAQLLALLADGDFHSGTELGAQLGVSRAAVSKQVRALVRAGLEIHRVPGRGYKFADAVAPLDAATIGAALPQRAVDVPAPEIIEEIDSTNRYLMERAAVLTSGSACLAEVQRQGRGRRGRSWMATPYSNLLLSFAWRFETGPAALAGLSLAAGVAVLQALEEYGVVGAGLKWPNDIVWQERKLAGLLAEMQGEADGPSLVVLGVGINGYIAAADAARIDQPWVDIKEITKQMPDRNRLAALVLAHLAATCCDYAIAGFAGFRTAWEQRHAYQGRTVRLLEGSATWRGQVIGVDASGALRLRDSAGRERVFHSGEISLREQLEPVG